MNDLSNTINSPARITVLGAGFAGLSTIRELRQRDAHAEITLVAPRAELHYLPGIIWIPSGLRSRAVTWHLGAQGLERRHHALGDASPDRAGHDRAFASALLAIRYVRRHPFETHSRPSRSPQEGRMSPDPC